MDSRAAVFTSSPQSVEVYRAGVWWQGELLGWRHDAAGACQMWVRVGVAGVEETSWVDLTALRLPEHTPAPVLASVGDVTATAAMPAVRATAPAVAVDAPTVSVSRPGGRRRAPEGDDVRVAAAAVSVSPGRHRAARVEGRHRAADTDVFAPVAGEGHRAPGTPVAPAPTEARRSTRGHTGAGWPIPTARAARPEESYGRSEVCTGRIDAEPDLLTRPMRLGDLTGGSRRPRAGGSLSGV
jgi:hypothetical protein